MAKSFTFVFPLLGALIVLAAFEQINADDPWVLPGFNKNEASRLNKNGRKCWMNSIYKVCLTKNADGMKLYWQNRKNTKSEVLVRIEIDNFGNITQDWKYEDAVIQMTLLDNGASKQTWKFGNDKFELNRDNNGMSEEKWEGSEQPEKVKNFKTFINSWCENNDFFIDKDDCAIYSKTKETEPEWILPGFDKTQVNQLNENGRKCWEENEYYVCLRKNLGKTHLEWYKGRTDSETMVVMDVTSKGNIYQEWTHQGNRVEISRYSVGTAVQNAVQEWNFKSSKFIVNTDPDNGAIEKRWEGEENPQALKEYQQFIDAWCENNDFFVGKQNCRIYEI